MIGVILASLSSLFNEIATSIGKYEVRNHKESVYTMGFLNLFWGTVLLFIIALARDKFVFSLASLPTFGLRAILEIAQTHVTLMAIMRSDRSTFGFLRILTIPLLLATDVILGYSIDLNQMLGIGLIVFSLIFLFINHGLSKNGAGLVLFTAINSVATISLMKYDITHFNSVEGEQMPINAILMIYLFVMAFFAAKENPLKYFAKWPLFLQSAAMGLTGVAGSFAMSFAPASIINTAERSSAILFATVSGNVYFKEKHVFIKLISLALIVAGLLMLVQ